MENGEPKIAVYGGTENTYEQLTTAAKSLLANSDVDKVYFLIETDDFPYELPDVIETINVKNQTYFPEWGENYNCKWTYFSFLRLAMSKMFPQHNRVVWLDTDTIVLGDLDGLFNAPLGSRYFYGAVLEKEKYLAYCFANRDWRKGGEYYLEQEPIFKTINYYNSGILVCNLELLRNEKMDDNLIDIVNNQKLSFPDQDAINLLCVNRILAVDQAYNFAIFTQPSEKIKIIHSSHDISRYTVAAYDKYHALSWESIMEWRNKRRKKE